MECSLPHSHCKHRGIDIDFMNAVAEVLNVRTTYVLFTNNSYNQAAFDLAAGKYDVTSPRMVPLEDRLLTAQSITARALSDEIALMVHADAMVAKNQLSWFRVFDDSIWVMIVVATVLWYNVSVGRRFRLVRLSLLPLFSLITILLQTFILMQLVYKLALPFETKNEIYLAVSTGRFTPVVWKDSSILYQLKDMFGISREATTSVLGDKQLMGTLASDSTRFYIGDERHCTYLVHRNREFVRSVRLYSHFLDYTTCLTAKKSCWNRPISYAVNMLRQFGITQAIYYRNYKRYRVPKSSHPRAPIELGHISLLFGCWFGGIALCVLQMGIAMTFRSIVHNLSEIERFAR